jgi:hypothetical protein
MVGIAGRWRRPHQLRDEVGAGERTHATEHAEHAAWGTVRIAIDRASMSLHAQQDTESAASGACRTPRRRLPRSVIICAF